MAERLELADEVALAGFGVGAAFEVVGAEVLVGGLVGEDVPDDAELDLTRFRGRVMG